MRVPEVIPISHEPDHRTSTIGRWRDGQFLASVTAAFPEGWRGEDWRAAKRWFAVLHRFDTAGRHLDSRIACTGGTADGERAAIAEAERVVAHWLEALPGRRYADIAIAPFALRREGVLFGLVVEGGADGDTGVRAELYPDGLGFFPPWDGSYDT
ncbi:hypothetical protein [Streptomyces sp. NPDC057702]|uniref:hypothetical protein n=1 Tax=unclassified Streptomyces TaxID=2593676 RepID=UPI00369EC145